MNETAKRVEVRLVRDAGERARLLEATALDLQAAAVLPEEGAFFAAHAPDHTVWAVMGGDAEREGEGTADVYVVSGPEGHRRQATDDMRIRLDHAFR